ncbi:hypothetical protein ADUPG1_011808, partial [Aduncisulcus paluster]
MAPKRRLGVSSQNIKSTLADELKQFLDKFPSEWSYILRCLLVNILKPSGLFRLLVFLVHVTTIIIFPNSTSYLELSVVGIFVFFNIFGWTLSDYLKVFDIKHRALLLYHAAKRKDFATLSTHLSKSWSDSRYSAVYPSYHTSSSLPFVSNSIEVVYRKTPHSSPIPMHPALIVKGDIIELADNAVAPCVCECVGMHKRGWIFKRGVRIDFSSLPDFLFPNHSDEFRDGTEASRKAMMKDGPSSVASLRSSERGSEEDFKDDPKEDEKQDDDEKQEEDFEEEELILSRIDFKRLYQNDNEELPDREYQLEDHFLHPSIKRLYRCRSTPLIDALNDLLQWAIHQDEHEAWNNGEEGTKDLDNSISPAELSSMKKKMQQIYPHGWDIPKSKIVQNIVRNRIHQSKFALLMLQVFILVISLTVGYLYEFFAYPSHVFLDPFPSFQSIRVFILCHSTLSLLIVSLFHPLSLSIVPQLCIGLLYLMVQKTHVEREEAYGKLRNALGTIEEEKSEQMKSISGISTSSSTSSSSSFHFSHIMGSASSSTPTSSTVQHTLDKLKEMESLTIPPFFSLIRRIFRCV